MISIRPATPEDVGLVLSFVRELAEYERLLDDARSTEADLRAALFGEQPKVFCDLAQWEGRPVGFALWFYTFSTFKGRHGIYLEDLYVRPQHRGRGIGRALLADLAERCSREGLARLEWAVLNWNAPSIAFYESLGARPLSEGSVYRLAGDALKTNASQATGHAQTRAPRSIRSAATDDTAVVHRLISEFAESQRLAYEFETSENVLRDALFCERPTVFCDLAEWAGQPVGVALWIYSFSTFNGRHGIFLEDLYVRPEHRRRGLGRALLAALADRCIAEKLARLEWGVGNWNTPSIAFYESIGAAPQGDWTVYRLTGDALQNLAEREDA